MPPLIPIIVGAAFAASGIGGLILGGGALALSILGLGVSLVLGGLSRLLLPKVPSLSQFTQEARGRTITARQAVAPWRVIHGEIRVGGVITFLHVTGATKEFLHIVITLAGHEVEQIGDMFFDGVLVPLDGSGDATGKFLNHVHVEKNLGTDSQAAFPGLLADAPTKWTANHRQRGRAGVYVRLKFNPDKFPGQIPNITFDVKGKKVYDPRTQESIAAAPTGADRTANVVTITTTAAHGFAVNDRARVDGVADDSFNGDFDIDTVPSATTFTYAQTGPNATSGGGTAGIVAWSKNAALCFSDYLLDTGYGVAVVLTKVDNAAWVAAANLAEEQVALSGGGFEDRYTCNGSFLVSERPSDIMLALLTAMGGTAVYSGGLWFIYGAAFRSPTLTFDEGDLRGPIRVQSRTARRDLFNAVKGVYVSAANNWQPSDFPPVTNAAFESEDGGTRIFRDIDLPYTISSATAQRLAKIELERARRQKTVELRLGPTALQAQPPDVIQFSVSRFGWSSKTFEIIDERLMLEQDADGTPRPEIGLTMHETDSAVYDWSAEESAPTAPGDPDLPDPSVAAPPTALVLSSFSLTRTDGIRITFLRASWTAPADEFVTAGGMIEIEYKKNSSGTWLPVSPVPGNETEKLIPNVDDGVAYDVRIRSVNVALARSAYVQQLNFTVTGAVASIDNDLISGKGILLMRNPDFESGDKNWTKESVWSIVNDPTNAYDGDWVGKFDDIAQATPFAIFNSIFIPVQAGEVLLATCMAKRTAGTGTVKVGIRWYNSSKTFTGTAAGTAIASSTYQLSRVVATAPSNTFFAQIAAMAPNTTAFVDAFGVTFFPIDLDDVGDSPTRLAPDPTYFDGSRRPNRLRRSASDLLAADIIRTAEESRLNALALTNAPAEAGANITETRTAAAISGQGALATLSAAAWASQVSGRPAELTDGRITAVITSSKTLVPGKFNAANVGVKTIGQDIVGPASKNNPAAGWVVFDSAEIDVGENTNSVIYVMTLPTASVPGSKEVDGNFIGFSITTGAPGATPQVSRVGNGSLTQNNPVVGAGKTLSLFVKIKTGGAFQLFSGAKISQSTLLPLAKGFVT